MNNDLIILNSVYNPREDSYLLMETIINFVSVNTTKIITFLEMGTGSGIISINLIKIFPNLHGLAVDINIEAVKCAKMNVEKNNISNSLLEIRNSNLFDQIKINEKFDLIFFNPPYVASFEDEKKKFNDAQNWAGGKFGCEIIKQFINEVKKYLNNDGKIILLFSSQNHGIKDDLNKKFITRELSRLELPEEVLYCFLLENTKSQKIF